MADTRGASFQLAVPADATIYKTYIPTSADITTHAWIIDNVFGETGAAPFNFFCWFRVQLELIGTAMHSFGVHESFGISISGNDFAKVSDAVNFVQPRIKSYLDVANATHSIQTYSIVLKNDGGEGQLLPPTASVRAGPSPHAVSLKPQSTASPAPLIHSATQKLPQDHLGQSTQSVQTLPPVPSSSVTFQELDTLAVHMCQNNFSGATSEQMSRMIRIVLTNLLDEHLVLRAVQVMYEALLFKAGLASMAVQSRDGVACVLSVLTQHVKHRTICRSCCLVLRRLAELRDIRINAHLISSNVHGLLAQAKSLHTGTLFWGICDDTLACLGLQPPADSPVMASGNHPTPAMPASRWGYDTLTFMNTSPKPVVAVPQPVPPSRQSTPVGATVPHGEFAHSKSTFNPPAPVSVSVDELWEAPDDCSDSEFHCAAAPKTTFQAARVAHAPPAAIKSPVPAHAATRTPAFPAVDPIPEQDIWEFNDDDSDVDAPKQSHVVEARAPAKEQTEPTQQASNPLALALKAARKPTLTAADALKTLTQVSEALQRPGSDTTLISEDPNTIPAVLGAIRRFPADSRVQDAAVFCIRLLACIGSDDVCTALMDMGAAELLYAVLKCGMPERVTHARVALRCCGLAPPPQDAPRVPIGPPTSTSASICIDSGPARMIQLSAASAIVESTSTSASDASIAEYQTEVVQAPQNTNPAPRVIKRSNVPVPEPVTRFSAADSHDATIVFPNAKLQKKARVTLPTAQA